MSDSKKEPITEKLCKDCNKVLPLESFTKHSGCVGGVNSHCKACAKIRLQKKKVEKALALQTLPAEAQVKTCADCGVSKPFTDYYLRPAMKDGLSAACKACIRVNANAANAALNAALPKKVELPPSIPKSSGIAPLPKSRLAVKDEVIAALEERVKELERCVDELSQNQEEFEEDVKAGMAALMTQLGLTPIPEAKENDIVEGDDVLLDEEEMVDAMDDARNEARSIHPFPGLSPSKPDLGITQ